MEIRNLVTQTEKVEADVAIVNHVNEKLVNLLTETEHQCWTSAQNSRRECLEVVGIPTFIASDLLEANVSKVFDKFRVCAEVKDIQACYCLKDRTIIKFSNRKGSLKIFLVKKDLKLLGQTELHFSEDTRVFVQKN